MNSKIARTLSLVAVVAMFCLSLAGCATDTSGTASTGGSTVFMIGYIIVIFGLLYIFMVRPEKKRKKKLEEMRDSLSVGDQVTTIGGIVGKIVHVKDDFIVIETSEDRVRIEIAKWAIGTNGKAATQDEK
jgi:preprotein translocase subunit YajC